MASDALYAQAYQIKYGVNIANPAKVGALGDYEGDWTPLANPFFEVMDDMFNNLDTADGTIMIGVSGEGPNFAVLSGAITMDENGVTSIAAASIGPGSIAGGWMLLPVGNDLPDPGGATTGDLFYELDAQRLWTFDGASWNDITSSVVVFAESLDGVTNPGGDIDLVATGGIVITPDNGANTITFDTTALALDSDVTTVSGNLATHVADTANPHSVTATQTGALVSVEGVSNAGGGIDLTVTGTGLTITGDNGANTIDFDVSGLATAANLGTTNSNLSAHTSNTANPHATTAVQVGAPRLQTSSPTNDTGTVYLSGTIRAGQGEIIVTSAGNLGELIKLAASQTADALQVQNSAGTVLVKIDKDGNMTIVNAFAKAARYFLNGIVWLDSGTAFPGSPADGDRFYRSDLKTECEYDTSTFNGPDLWCINNSIVKDDFSRYAGTAGGGIGWPTLSAHNWVEVTGAGTTSAGKYSGSAGSIALINVEHNAMVVQATLNQDYNTLTPTNRKRHSIGLGVAQDQYYSASDGVWISVRPDPGAGNAPTVYVDGNDGSSYGSAAIGAKTNNTDCVVVATYKKGIVNVWVDGTQRITDLELFDSWILPTAALSYAVSAGIKCIDPDGLGTATVDNFIARGIPNA